MSAPKFIEIEGVEFATDSPLEGEGFELSVPRRLVTAADGVDAFVRRWVTRLPRGGATPLLVCCIEASERPDDTPRRLSIGPNPDEASKALLISRGTKSSNPFRSSGESGANRV